MARYAKKGSTRQDIINKMLEFIRKDNEVDPEDFDENDEDQIIRQYLSSMAYSDSQARKDLEKIDFDFENCEGATEGSRVLPDQTPCWSGASPDHRRSERRCFLGASGAYGFDPADRLSHECGGYKRT